MPLGAGRVRNRGLGRPRTARHVFSVNPIHHPSGLLMSLGGAIASGARFSMASRFDPDTFWNEARRYGVTVVSYTWTQLRDLVEAPRIPASSTTRSAPSSDRDAGRTVAQGH